MLSNCVVINYGFGIHQWNVRFTDVVGGLRVSDLPPVMTLSLSDSL